MRSLRRVSGLSGRQASLEFVKTFGRLGKATIARRGCISFEWPRHCEGWKEEVVMSMMNELKLEPVEIDGCAALPGSDPSRVIQS